MQPKWQRKRDKREIEKIQQTREIERNLINVRW